MRPLAVILLASALALSSAAQTAPQTKVTLISDSSTVKPGSEFWVGIQFQLEPGWHTYWVNPGDSGEPAKIDWSLPAGWSAGPLVWPPPRRMSNPAGVDYGYEDQVILLTKITVGSAARSGVGEYLLANMRWLVCREMCISQKGTPRTMVRVGDKVEIDPNGKPAIDAVQARLPKNVPATWKANVLSNPSQWLINFRPGVKVSSATFFPLQPQVVDNSAPQKLSATSMRAQLTLKKDAGAKATDVLKGVLLLNGSDAYNIDLPVRK
jgi:DsbC/DsbD-like thiol-disulfide interchange protein